MLRFCLFILALNVAPFSAMFSPRLISRTLSLRSAPISKFLSSTQAYADLNFLATVQSAHESYLVDRSRKTDRSASHSIAMAAHRDPVISEISRMMVPLMDGRLSEDFKTDFKRLDEVSTVFEFQEDRNGKFLLVRDGLMEIRAGNGKLILTRPKETAKTLAKLRTLSLMLKMELTPGTLTTPIEEFAELFTQLSLIINEPRTIVDKTDEEDMLNTLHSSEYYKDYGLLLRDVNLDQKSYSVREYCESANLAHEECQAFETMTKQLS